MGLADFLLWLHWIRRKLCKVFGVYSFQNKRNLRQGVDGESGPDFKILCTKIAWAVAEIAPLLSTVLTLVKRESLLTCTETMAVQIIMEVPQQLGNIHAFIPSKD